MTEKKTLTFTKNFHLSRGDIVLFYFPVRRPDPVLDLPSPCLITEAFSAAEEEFVTLLRGIPVTPATRYHPKPLLSPSSMPIWQSNGLSFAFDKSFPLTVSVANSLFHNSGKSRVIGHLKLQQEPRGNAFHPRLRTH